jgi:hypothetical protein
MNIRHARKYIDKGFETMFFLIESFSNDELNKIIKQNNYDIDAYDLHHFLYCAIDEHMHDLLTIRENEFKKSIGR